MKIQKINLGQANKLKQVLKETKITKETIFNLCNIKKIGNLNVQQYNLLLMLITRDLGKE